MDKKGFTIVELLLTTSLSAMVVGSVASVYLFAATRGAHTMATGATVYQAQGTARLIDRVISNATKASIVTSGSSTGLKCQMPDNSIDNDGDGIYDDFRPSKFTGANARWGKNGVRVWIYMADSTGDFLRPGSILWMAKRADDLYPTSADKTQAFAYYSDTASIKNNLIDSITWVANANGTITYTLNFSALTRADRRSPLAGTTDKTVSRTAGLTRTVMPRNTLQ